MTKVKKPNLSKALEGNQNGVKLKDKELRQLAYKQFCDWIASGKPKEAFFFEHEGHLACWETVESYAEKYPEEFSPLLMKTAKAKRYNHWFSKGENLADGKVRGNPSPQVWQTIMRNMFKEQKWDQHELINSNKPTEAVQFEIKKIENGDYNTQ